jgi:hypothetical protein
MMAGIIVVAGFLAVVAVFIIRYERPTSNRKKVSGRGGDFEA